MHSISTGLRRKTLRVGALCLAMFGACAVAQRAQAQGAAPAAAAATCRYVNIATLPVSLNDLTPTVEGSINHSQTAMLIDSGAQNTLLTKVETTKLGLSQRAPGGKHKKAAGDERLEVDELSIGSIELGKTRILALQSPADHAGYGALVGADFLFQHDVELALADRKIKFFNPLGCDTGFLGYWDSNASTVALEAMSPTDYRQVVTVEINGQKMRALIDTSAPMSILNLAAAARAGITPQSAGVTALAQAGGASTHAATAWVAPFDHFTIGGETINNVKIPILDLHGAIKAETARNIPDMLLGADFLRVHRVLFAVSQHLLYFTYLGGTVFRVDAAPQVAGAAQPK